MSIPNILAPTGLVGGTGSDPSGAGLEPAWGGAMIFPFPGTNYVNCASLFLAQFLLALEKALEEGAGAKSLAWSGVVFFLESHAFGYVNCASLFLAQMESHALGRGEDIGPGEIPVDRVGEGGYIGR